MAGCDEVNKVREALKVVQPMIDISADRLNGLRTQCATSVDLTRQEIRTLEGKLLKMFARQLVIKSKLKGDASKVFRDVPSVKQWLQVVGLQKDSIEGICEKVDSLETLQEKSDHELAVILKERQAKPDEFRRLCHALFNLKRYTDILKREDNAVEEPSDLALYWDSWDRHHKHRTGGTLSPHVSRSNRQYVSTTEDSNSVSQPLNNHDQNSSDSSSMSSIASSFIQSPPPTPPVNSKTKGGDKQKFPSTPPPHKKHHTSSIVATTVLVPGSYPLTKSKSHESQLSGRAPENGDTPSLDLQVSGARRGRLPTEPGPTNHCGSDKTSSTFSTSPMTSPQNSSPTQKHSVSIISSHSSPIVLSPTSVTNPSDMSSPTNISASPLTMSPGPISPKVISPGTPNSATPVHKTPSPLTPGPFTPRHTPSPNTPNACSTVSPMTVSPMGSSPVVVSPGSLSPIPGSPIPFSPIVVKTSVVLNSVTTPITPGGPNVPNSSPITPHSTNSTTVSPVKSPGTPLSDSGDNNCSQISTNISITLVSPHHKQAPTSPDGTSHSMRHTIAHRFVKMYRMIATCNYCDRQILFVTGLKCRECKYKCHRECESKVPASCGLPNDLVRVFMEASSTQSPNPGATPMPSPIHYHPNNNSLRPSLKPGKKKSHPHPSVSVAPFVGPDSSSNTSSCNSSTPSSPALVSVHTPISNKTHFHFPEVERGRTLLETHPIEELAETRTSNDSDKTVSVCGSGSGGSASTDSERTPVRVDSQESQVSDSEIVNERDGQKWPRQNSQISMREWDIPYDELKIGEPIGKGRFGIVYRGNWHGDVAIKVLNTDYLDDDKALEAFKSEVGTFRKTRHENLVLFMGACMKLPQLAIVTSLSKGMTLYTHIHLRKDKFTMNKTTIIAQQISQGMGYLHARGIVHKDLKSKNIFLENGKVVITDFGLFSVTKLCYANGKGNSLNIPPGWLCYLAPEIIRSLRANLSHHELNFSKASDIYAFGTVWYELLCGEWPFKGQAPEAVIWQVGKGMKQPLANLQASRDVKDILMLCWSFRPNDRREFSYLFSLLEKLPKKRLARSPSHPVHLSRSAESVF